MTIKNSKFSETVASDMDKILEDANFKKIFARPALEREIQAELKPDTKYQAFVRIASTSSSSDDCLNAADGSSSSSMNAKDKSSSSSKKPTDVSDVMNIDDILGPSVNVLASSKAKAKNVTEESSTESSSSTETKKPKKKIKKADVGLAVEYMINSLLQTSAALDNLGLDKSATLSLSLIDSLIKEASIIALGQEAIDQMAERVNEMSPEDILADGNDKKMSSGYVYELEGSDDWKDSADDIWTNEVYTPKGDEAYVGERKIDDSDVSVFKGTDGKYYAQLPQNTTLDENAADVAKPHEDVVVHEVGTDQKDPSNKHEAPPQSIPLTDKHHHSHLVDYNNAETEKPHEDVVNQNLNETQKDPSNKHEAPAQSLPLANQSHHGHLVDYNKDDDKPIYQVKPVDKMPKPEPTVPSNPTTDPYKKDLIGLASLLDELETWIKK